MTIESKLKQQYFIMAESIECDSRPVGSNWSSLPPSRSQKASQEWDKELPHYDFVPITGKYLVFNHFDFSDETFSKRYGTEFDVNAIEQTFNALNFKGKVYNDLKTIELYETLKTTFEDDFSDFGSLVVFILTHGDKDTLLHAYNEPYKLESILHSLLSNQSNSLVGKPKIFIIQACQGEIVDDGVGGGEKSSPGDGDLLPIHADVLIAYAAPNGFVGHRNTHKGSWFIQTLCEAVRQRSSKDDLETILKIARRRVAVDSEFEYKNKDESYRKQIPVAVTTLTKTFYLTENAFKYRENR